MKNNIVDFECPWKLKDKVCVVNGMKCKQSNCTRCGLRIMIEKESVKQEKEKLNEKSKPIFNS